MPTPMDKMRMALGCFSPMSPIADLRAAMPNMLRAIRARQHGRVLLADPPIAPRAITTSPFVPSFGQPSSTTAPTIPPVERPEREVVLVSAPVQAVSSVHEAFLEPELARPRNRHERRRDAARARQRRVRDTAPAHGARA